MSYQLVEPINANQFQCDKIYISDLIDMKKIILQIEQATQISIARLMSSDSFVDKFDYVKIDIICSMAGIDDMWNYV